MKKIFVPFFILFTITQSFAQTPQAISYQAISRNALGQVIPNQIVGVRFSILEGSANGSLAYQETQFVTTNAFGLFTLEIGGGNATFGTFPNINWGTGTKFLKTEIAPGGGTNYLIQGTTQLLSVPYALYADKTKLIAGNAITITNGNTISGNYIAGPGININANTISSEASQNILPVSNAGPARNITLPQDNLTLTGSGTDADGQVVAYLWSQVSGPGATTIVNAGSPSTLVKGFIPGNYSFQLMVTDNKGATVVNTVPITVTPGVATTTLSLQPAANPTEYQLSIFNGQNTSGVGVGRTDIPMVAWTNNGAPVYVREIIKFDLSSIPSTATITSATLYLYSDPAPQNGNLVNANSGTANSMSVQQVTSNWTSATTTWSTQPSVATANKITIPQTNLPFLDLNLDVTNMVSSMVNNNTNYGFFLRLENEVFYNSRIFVGSYNSSLPAKHPKLVVTYQ